MIECEKLSKRLREICEGTAGIPLRQVNFYRERWGLYPLEELPISESQTTQVSRGDVILKPSCGGCKGGKKKSTSSSLNSHGPGEQLIKIYTRLGMPTCQACLDLAQKMNEWGIEGCQTRLDDIVEDIFPRAQEWIKSNHPWVHALLPNIVEDTALRWKIRSDVEAAIKAAKIETKESV